MAPRIQVYQLSHPSPRRCGLSLSLPLPHPFPPTHVTPSLPYHPCTSSIYSWMCAARQRDSRVVLPRWTTLFLRPCTNKKGHVRECAAQRVCAKERRRQARLTVSRIGLDSGYELHASMDTNRALPTGMTCSKSTKGKNDSYSQITTTTYTPSTTHTHTHYVSRIQSTADRRERSHHTRKPPITYPQ